MEPQIQYAQTEDGVNIAFYEMGEGKPLVYMTGWPFQHLQLEWQHHTYRRIYEPLLEKRRLIRFDGRGAGLSGGSVTDGSLDARLLDLDCVVERIGLEKFDLLGHATSGPVGIAYAARYQDRLSHLVLWNTYARSTDFEAIPRVHALAGLLDTDWEMFTETFAHVAFGWSEGEEARDYAAFMRECISHEGARSIVSMPRADVSELLPRVSAPTLVLQYRDTPFQDMGIARGLASRIPGARLVLLEGDYLSYEQTVRTILEFLGEREEVVSTAKQPAANDIHTILFTDVEGSTAMTDRLGDAKARDLLREHERVVRQALKSHGGSEVKTMGDGFMASFSSAIKALECAIAMQRAFAAHNESADEIIKVRVGLNAGEPIAEDDPNGRSDLFGASVNRAARIAAMAQGGEILVANVVRELAEGKEFMFGDRGETALRGFDDPVRLFEVRWRDD